MVGCVRAPEEVAAILGAGIDAVAVSGAPGMVRGVMAAVGGRRPVIALAPPGEAAGPVNVLATVATSENVQALLPKLQAGGYLGAVLTVASPGRLLDHAAIAEIGGFVAACRAHGLQSGLSGGLESPDVPRLLLLEPDWLLFDDALRDEDGALDRQRMRLIRGQMPPDLSVADGADYRLLAGRFPRDAEPDEGDRIFVHDWVLPVHIGAYAHERLAPQPVRFSIDVVVRHARNPTDLRDVLSYDVITDGIRLLVADGHVPLVETLAERIAAMMLGHPRVLRVTVKLEKLATGSGIVGVAIARNRPMRAAISPTEEQRTR